MGGTWRSTKILTPNLHAIIERVTIYHINWELSVCTGHFKPIRLSNKIEDYEKELIGVCSVPQLSFTKIVVAISMGGAPINLP